MKKKLAATLSVVLILGLATLGILAYLTDTESAMNTMESGKVDIELIEQERGEDGELQNFTQGKDLLPIVGSAQGQKDKWGLPVAGNYVDKIVSVKNIGNYDAYVRVIVGVPAALEAETADGNALHWNVGNRFDATGNYAYNGEQWNPDYNNTTMKQEEDTVEIEGVTYNIYSFTYNTALPAGEAMDGIFVGFYLDEDVDYDDETKSWMLGNTVIDYDLSKGVKIPVLAQAVQSDGWDSISTTTYKSRNTVNVAVTALNTTFGEVIAENEEGIANVVTWFYGSEGYDVITSNVSNLITSLSTGGKVVMTGDINAGRQVKVDNDGVLDGNGNTITVSSGAAEYESGLTVTSGTAKNITVTGAYRGLGVGGSGASAMTGNVTYENVTVTGATYGVNIGVGNGHSLTMINCTFGDWNSYSGLGSAEFIGCTFTSEGNYYASQRISENATFTYKNCEFNQNTYNNVNGSENYYLDSYGNGTIVLDNCTVNGIAVTNANVNELFQIANVKVDVK